MLRALCLVLLWAIPAQAQSDRVVLEWARWLHDRGDPPGALVFLIGEREVLAQDSSASVDDRLPLASNSKAITALCAAALVEDGLLDWDWPVRRWLYVVNSDVTVADLVTHTSGLWPDETQGAMALWRGETEPRWHPVSMRALMREPVAGARGTYRYNNENYAILGTIIEQVTGRPYDSVCAERVLDPLGITTARLSPVYGGYGPWGGWEMSVRDYARFMVGAVARNDPAAGPTADLGDGLFYGPGMLFRTGYGMADQWHFGALCFGGDGIGAFAVNWAGRYTVVAAYDACIDEAAMAGLHAALARAVFAD